MGLGIRSIAPATLCMRTSCAPSVSLGAVVMAMPLASGCVAVCIRGYVDAPSRSRHRENGSLSVRHCLARRGFDQPLNARANQAAAELTPGEAAGDRRTVRRDTLPPEPSP